MNQNNTYMSTFNDIRSTIHMRNTQLPTYTEVETVEPNELTDGVHHSDKSMLKHSHEKNASIQFVASINTFSFHWETMTIQQKQKYLLDYIESEYPDYTPNQKTAVQSFLEKEIIGKKNGNRRVKWNGYFIETLPELILKETTTHTEDDTDTVISIKFKPSSGEEAEHMQREKQEKNISFAVIRAKLQREKEQFYVQK
jgi:hypothetical protein